MPPLHYEDIYGADNNYGNANGASSVSPYDSDSLLNNPLVNNFATRGLMSGIQWLGETLSKPQRALFGLAAGRPEELANLIPFSDTLGITDPTKAVSGRDLLRQYGLADKEDNWGNFGAGLALDVVADPLAWIRGPLGALTKAGEAAQKGAGVERSLIGRMQSGQGGLFGIADKPWYAEMLGGGPQKNVYVAGARDASNLNVATSPMLEKFAQGLDTGWDKATRFTLPGTEFSPVAWMRSAFEPGAANVTGHPTATASLGRSVTPAVRENEALAGELSLPLFKARSEASNELVRRGIPRETADQWLWRATTSFGEGGRVRLPEGPLHPDVADYLNKVGPDLAARMQNVTSPVLSQANTLGAGIDEAGGIFRHGYVPQAKAGTGINPSQQEMARSPLIDQLAYRSTQFEDYATNPALTGYGRAKEAGKPFDQAAVNAQRKAAEDFLTQDIKAKSAQRLAEDPTLISEQTSRMATEEGAREHASKVADYLMGLDPAIPERGHFYRQDIATTGKNYAVQEGRKNAMRHGVMEALTKESGDVPTMLTKVSDTADVVPLTKALDEIGLRGTSAAPNAAKEELARRLNVPVGDLDKRGVDASLVKALKRELEGPRAEKSNWWSNLVDNFRYGVTVPWPANLVRNTVSSQVEQILSGEGARGGISAAKYLQGALDPKHADYAKLRKYYPEAIAYGVAGNSEQMQLVGTGITRSGQLAVNTDPAQAAKSIGQIVKEGAAPVYSEKSREAMGITSFGGSKIAGGKANASSNIPAKVQRFDESGVADFSKPNGVYTTPADALSPHKEAGSKHSLYDTNPNAKVLEVDVQGLGKGITNRKTAGGLSVGEDTGIAAARKLIGDDKVKSYMEMDKTSLRESLSQKYPGVDWNRFNGDQHDMVSAVGAIEAKKLGYDALWSKSQKSRKVFGSGFDEYVALNEKAFITSSATPPSVAKDASEWLREKAAKVVDPIKGYAGMMETSQRLADDAARLQQFANLREAGYSSQAAAERVGTIQRKYSESTPFVRDMRNFVPFVNFAYSNAKTQADLLSRQPGRYGALMSLMNSGRADGGFVPGYASSGSAIPLGGKDSEGRQTFLGSLGLTQEDELLSAATSFLAGRPTEGIRKVASASNPILKAIYEQATGTQVFSGRKLDDLNPSALASVLTGGNENAARFLSQAVSGTPLARGMSTIDRIADADRRGIGSTALNLLTGLRTTTVDTEAARQIAARDTLTQLLNASNQYKLREQLVVDPKWKGREDEIPEPLREMWNLYQALQRQGKIVAQQKAAN